MTHYFCPTCNWLCEVPWLPASCQRCGAELVEITEEEFKLFKEADDVAWCPTCEAHHRSSQRTHKSIL